MKLNPCLWLWKSWAVAPEHCCVMSKGFTLQCAPQVFCRAEVPLSCTVSDPGQFFPLSIPTRQRSWRFLLFIQGCCSLSAAHQANPAQPMAFPVGCHTWHIRICGVQEHLCHHCPVLLIPGSLRFWGRRRVTVKVQSCLCWLFASRGCTQPLPRHVNLFCKIHGQTVNGSHSILFASVWRKPKRWLLRGGLCIFLRNRKAQRRWMRSWGRADPQVFTFQRTEKPEFGFQWCWKTWSLSFFRWLGCFQELIPVKIKPREICLQCELRQRLPRMPFMCEYLPLWSSGDKGEDVSSAQAMKLLCRNPPLLCSWKRRAQQCKHSTAGNRRVIFGFYAT